MKLNPTIRIIPIIYDSLPDKNKFMTLCENITSIINGNELFQYYGIKVIFEKDFISFSPYLIEGVIPPKELRYNSMDGWLTVDDKIRWRLAWLTTSKPVKEGSDLYYPNIDKRDILLAIIPLSIQTTSRIWTQESHFVHGGSFAGSPLKALSILYHVSLTDEKKNFFKEFNAENIAHSLVEHIAQEHMRIDDIQMEMIKIEFGYETKSKAKEDELFKRLRVLFYGNDICTSNTLKRALLLFDDIHFHDRPSYRIGALGTIGADSRIRRYVYSFAHDGIPVLVHKGMSTWLSPNVEDAVANELEDSRFSKIFFEGFKSDSNFRNLFIQESANYGKGKGYEISKAMMKLDLGNRPYDLNKYKKLTIEPFDPHNERSLEETFVNLLIDASMKLNLCCSLTHENDLIPFTEYAALDKLMSLRYRRIIEKGEISSQKPEINLIHLSHKIFDYVIPESLLDKVSMEDTIKFRHATREEYVNFKKYLMKLNSLIEANVWNETLEKEINTIIHQEVIPAVDQFQNECKRIWEKMIGNVIKKVTGIPKYAGLSSFAISYLTGLTWIDVFVYGCSLAAPTILPHVVDYALEKRNLKRQNALTYLMKARKI